MSFVQNHSLLETLENFYINSSILVWAPAMKGYRNNFVKSVLYIVCSTIVTWQNLSPLSEPLWAAPVLYLSATMKSYRVRLILWPGGTCRTHGTGSGTDTVTVGHDVTDVSCVCCRWQHIGLGAQFVFVLWRRSCNWNVRNMIIIW